MSTHSDILPWRLSWAEEPGRQQSTGLQRVRTTERLSTKKIIQVEGEQDTEEIGSYHGINSKKARTIVFTELGGETHVHTMEERV